MVDAIAAARAVISGEAIGHPKSHDGGVEALRALKMVHRSAHKSRTQALNQIRDLITTTPEDLRGVLRGLKRKTLLATCSAFRPGDRDDLVSVTKLALRGLARRVLELDEEIALLDVRRRRITTAVAPELVAAFGVGPDTAANNASPSRLDQESSSVTSPARLTSYCRKSSKIDSRSITSLCHSFGSPAKEHAPLRLQVRIFGRNMTATSKIAAPAPAARDRQDLLITSPKTPVAR